MDQPSKVTDPAHGQLNREKYTFLCPRSRLRIWSRETDSVIPSRVSLLISIPRLHMALILTGFLPIFAAAFIYLFKSSYTIGPSLSGHTIIAYRWHSLPRVRRHRANGPKGSSSDGCCLCIPMDQLCAPLFSTPTINNYWYEVGMLKASAINSVSLRCHAYSVVMEWR